jgi:hypothetical protein
MQELDKILEELKRIKDGNRKEKLYAKYPPNSKDQEVLNAYSQGYEDGTDNFYNAAAEIIRNHMDDGWIPVEERLPIPNKEIWVTVKRNGNVFTSTDGMTEKGHFWNYEKENILAWKEKELIPEPYRPERSMN